MLRRLSHHLYTWVEVHGASRGEPYTWNSHLVHAEHAGIRALIDPLPLSAEDMQKIEEIGHPTHILLTCNYHERDCETFKRWWGCKILLHEYQTTEAECEYDGTFRDREMLWDLVEVIRVPNVRFREEVCFFLAEDSALAIGDLVSGGRRDLGIPDGEIGIPGPEYYVDLREARNSLRDLLALSFRLMCFGHGSPITSGAREVLGQFVASDAVWDRLQIMRDQRRGGGN